MRNSHSAPRGIGRRGFLGTAGTLAVTGTLGSPGRGEAKAGPNEKVGIGIIGVGNRGSVLLQNLLQIPGVEVRGVCDIDPDHLKKGQKMVAGAGSPEPAGTDGLEGAARSSPASTRSSAPSPAIFIIRTTWTSSRPARTSTARSRCA